MSEALNYFVDFHGDFARPASSEDFCKNGAGEEAAQLLADQLPSHGIEIVNVEGGDDGHHYVRCLSGDSTIELMIGLHDFTDENSRWLVMPCAKQTFFGRKPHPDADLRPLLFAIDKSLKACDRISEIRWFPHFETPDYLALLPASEGPLRKPEWIQNVPLPIRLEWQCGRLTRMIFSPLRTTAFVVIVLLFAGIAPNLVGILFCAYVAAIFLFGFVAPLVLTRIAYFTAKRPDDTKQVC